ncbi:MAG: hypothetical protein HYS57_01925 [Parcubacteria group bacterium]|nr:hypothetical protein [Parcubacteria group bacterium]
MKEFARELLNFLLGLAIVVAISFGTGQLVASTEPWGFKFVFGGFVAFSATIVGLVLFSIVGIAFSFLVELGEDIVSLFQHKTA